MTDWTFFLVVALVALVYGKLETMIESGGRVGTTFVGKYSTYHVWLFFLDLVVCLPALSVSANFYLMCVVLFPLLEDLAFFLWRWERMRPEHWTCKGFGYFEVKGWIVPRWYVLVIAVAFYLRWLA